MYKHSQAKFSVCVHASHNKCPLWFVQHLPPQFKNNYWGAHQLPPNHSSPAYTWVTNGVCVAMSSLLTLQRRNILMYKYTYYSTPEHTVAFKKNTTVQHIQNETTGVPSIRSYHVTECSSVDYKQTFRTVPKIGICHDTPGSLVPVMTLLAHWYLSCHSWLTGTCHATPRSLVPVMRLLAHWYLSWHSWLTGTCHDTPGSLVSLMTLLAHCYFIKNTCESYLTSESPCVCNVQCPVLKLEIIHIHT